MTAKTSFGFEDLLAEELRQAGARAIRKGVRAVFYEGDMETMYRANLFSRTALRILKPVAEFPAATGQELYDGIRKTDWGIYITSEDTIAIDAVASKSALSHSLFIAQKAKDGIVDQIRNRTGQRPSVDTRQPGLRLNLHLHEDKATVSLDSSGSSLHRRGYRLQAGEAPLSETLAAGMVMLSGWDKQSPLADLMCGSGTILIEAAMYARNIAPGLIRNEFGFEKWRDFDAGLWESLKAEARKACLPGLSFPLKGIDKSGVVLKAATENARAAGVEGDIDFIRMSFEDFEPEQIPSVVITNPPYGGRITDDDLFDLYEKLGDTLKKKYAGTKAWILTANREAANHIGLHPSRKIPLYNGPLECRFLCYEMYGGSRKSKYIKGENSA